jgi:hypothetical protein
MNRTGLVIALAVAAAVALIFGIWRRPDRGPPWRKSTAGTASTTALRYCTSSVALWPGRDRVSIHPIGDRVADVDEDNRMVPASRPVCTESGAEQQ